ncbi:hypothetical protein [Nocardioides sp. LHG3406-4]|uniref:hypothetical protein n=1 Tax=Nocardioides sp. LHG3406-4 TaxID=2804575 RepID=UPI003CF4C302
MIGPLPRLHRIGVLAAVLLVCAAIGAWLGSSPSIPFLVGTGLVGGAAVGAVAAYALLHQPHTHDSRPRHRHR